MGKAYRCLYVGDSHVRPEDLDDSQAMLDLVVSTAKEYSVDRVVFLGDQFHSHAILHCEVMAFWLKNLARFVVPVWLLVGNHDQPGDAGSKSHSLLAFKNMDGITVVDEPLEEAGILHLPYYAERNDFIKACQESSAKTLVCHQTITGATYENGFYAQDGVDAVVLPQKYILSGHIHTGQSFGNVWYPGSPRWLNVNDGNVDKAIHVVEHDEDGFVDINTIRRINTSGVCSRIIHLKETPERLLDFKPETRHRYTIDLEGPQSWIEERRGKYAGLARIRTKRTDQAASKVRESDGIHVALRKYIPGFKPPNQTPIPVLETMVNARINS